LSLKIASLFKAFQLAIGINHCNLKVRLKLTLKYNWYNYNFNSKELKQVSLIIEENKELLKSALDEYFSK